MTKNIDCLSPTEEQAIFSNNSSTIITAQTAIKDLPQWITWKLEYKDNKATKVPYQVGSEYKASIKSTNHWTTYDKGAPLENKGFVFTCDDPYLFIDLDHVLNDGVLKPWARDIIEAIQSYTEVSPSGGLHIIVEAGDSATILKNKTILDNYATALEIYFKDRYATFTGDVFEGYDSVVKADTSILDKHAKFKVVTSSNHNSLHRTSLLSAIQVKDKIERKFKWDISSYDIVDQSSAHLSLANHIVFWSNGDRSIYDEVFELHPSSNRDKYQDRQDYQDGLYNRAT